MGRGVFETTKIWWSLICSQWPVPNSDCNATGLSYNHLEWGELSALWLTREPSSWIYVCPFLPTTASRMLLAIRELYRGFKRESFNNRAYRFLSLRLGLIKTSLNGFGRQHGVAGCVGTRRNLCPKQPEWGRFGTSCTSKSGRCVCSFLAQSCDWVHEDEIWTVRKGKHGMAWPSPASKAKG